jgi:hypothetical protein
MTLDEAVEILFETLGEPTDFNPYASDWVTLDSTSKGYQRLASLINSGQIQCSNYRRRRGGDLRFLALNGTHNVKIKQITVGFDIDNIDPTKITIRKADLPNNTIAETETYGRFTNCKFLIDDVYYDVESSVYDSLNVRWEVYFTIDLPVFIDRTAIIKKNTFMLVDRTHPWAYENFIKPDVLSVGYGRGNLVYILQMSDLTNELELIKASGFENFIFAGDNFDAPTEYNFIGADIRFDSFPDDGTRFSMNYYRTPTKLVNGTDTFEIPEQFHYGVILWAAWRGFSRLHEEELSVMNRNDYNTFMNSTKSDNDYRLMDTKGGSFVIKRS